MVGVVVARMITVSIMWIGQTRHRRCDARLIPISVSSMIFFENIVGVVRPLLIVMLEATCAYLQ